MGNSGQNGRTRTDAAGSVAEPAFRENHPFMGDLAYNPASASFSAISVFWSSWVNSKKSPSRMPVRLCEV